jgi:hypothetical protein
MSNKVTRIFKEPLLHFLLLGACIYGAYALFGAPEQTDSDKSIRVDAKRIDAFIAEWQSRWNRPPTKQEIDGLIQQFINEEVLYRQAVAMGLNENDPITRRRMAQKLEFLTSDLAQAQQPTEVELEKYFQENLDSYRAADLITFIQVFFDPDKRDETTLDDAKKALKELQATGEPDPEKLEVGDRFMLQNYFKSEDEAGVRRQLGSGFAESLMKLEEYFQENLDSYRAADLITFIQVFFDPDKRDETTLDDAKKALKELHTAGEPDPEKLEVGDRFMLQNYFKSEDEAGVRRQLGSGFAASLMKLEEGKWHGPVLSGYGVHLVYVYKIEKAPAPALEKVKAKVLEKWHEEKREQFNAAFLENLKSSYEIVIDTVPADRLIGEPKASQGKGESGAGEASSK